VGVKAIHEEKLMRQTNNKVAEILKSKMAREKCDPDVMPYFTDYYWIPKDEVTNLAQEIVNLFKAQLDKLTVISGKEIAKLICTEVQGDTWEMTPDKELYLNGADQILKIIAK